MIHSFRSADISIFIRNGELLLYQEIQIWIKILDIFSNSSNFFGSLKVALINMVTILMMSTKLATLDLLKIKVLWKKGCVVIIFVHDVTNTVLSLETSYIVDVVMWLKFGNSSNSLSEVIITSIQKKLLKVIITRRTNSFEKCFWFKFNDWDWH